MRKKYEYLKVIRVNGKTTDFEGPKGYGVVPKSCVDVDEIELLQHLGQDGWILNTSSSSSRYNQLEIYYFHREFHPDENHP